MAVERSVQMEETVWIIGIGALGALFVLSPLFSKNSKRDEAFVSDHRQQQKELVFSQLSDLEYDYQMKKLTESDYKRTKAELSAQASEFLDSNPVSKEEIEKEVDQEIEALIKGKGGSNYV
jgi:hypothetical protein